MSVTTKDIARICNVSRTTVNRAFNDSGRISAETKKLILDTARELNYRPDLLATSLKNGKTKSIGVVVFDVKNRFFAQMLNAVEAKASSIGYSVNISLHGKDKAKERDMLQRLADFRTDGIILSPVSKDDSFVSFLKELNRPVVIIGNRINGDIPFVGIDEERAARQAVRKIAENGYKRIVFVCPPLVDQENENIYSHEQRKRGFISEINNLSVENEVIGSWDYLDRVQKIMRDGGPRTAFFCSGDVYALDIMKALRNEKLSAGRDYGIMGFDNTDILDYIIPRLSTIDNEIERVAERAVEVLLSLIKGRKPAYESIIPFEIVEGETL